MADNRFVVVWQSEAQGDASGFGIWGRRYAANGQPNVAHFSPNSWNSSDQTRPSIAASDREFVVAWTSANQDGSGEAAYARVYQDDGRSFGTEFRLNTTTANNQNRPAVAMRPGRHFVGVWTSRNQDGSREGVYGQRFNIPASEKAR